MGRGWGEVARGWKLEVKKRYCGRVPLRVVTMPLAACVNAFFLSRGDGWSLQIFLRIKTTNMGKLELVPVSGLCFRVESKPEAQN